MEEVTKENFDDIVLKNDKPVLVDFWGPGCGRCIQMMPRVEELEKQYGDTVRFAKMNIQGNRRLAIRESVSSLPTILMYRGGEKIASFECDFTLEDVESKLKELSVG